MHAAPTLARDAGPDIVSRTRSPLVQADQYRTASGADALKALRLPRNPRRRLFAQVKAPISPTAPDEATFICGGQHAVGVGDGGQGPLKPRAEPALKPSWRTAETQPLFRRSDRRKSQQEGEARLHRVP
ncbi:hypothetical protein GCM10027161_62360 [Microbispora hainanensis]